MPGTLFAVPDTHDKDLKNLAARIDKTGLRLSPTLALALMNRGV